MLKAYRTDKSAGFSLLELIVVMVISGILVALAIPGYQIYLQHSYRLQAESDLLALAQALENYRLQQGRYGVAPEASDPITAQQLYAAHSPASKPWSERCYELKITAGKQRRKPMPKYRLEAIPVAHTLCADTGRLRYDSNGQRGWDRNHNGRWEDDERDW